MKVGDSQDCEDQTGTANKGGVKSFRSNTPVHQHLDEFQKLRCNSCLRNGRCIELHSRERTGSQIRTLAEFSRKIPFRIVTKLDILVHDAWPLACGRFTLPNSVGIRGNATLVPTTPICVISGSAFADLDDCEKSSVQILVRDF